MKIAFYSNQLCIRGTEIALFTYAKYNEEVLGNESVIYSLPTGDLTSLEKFEDRFEVNLLPFYAIEQHCKDNDVDYFYVIKGGNNDGLCLTTIPTLVHAVFKYDEMHGHRYAYVSDWLCKDQGYDIEKHSVPHIVEDLPLPSESWREKHNIPKNAKVFGCYGGSTEFNVTFVHDIIRNLAKTNSNVYFTFMNINNFMEEQNDNVIFLEGTTDLVDKRNFIEMCDAMLHARISGETFGFAVAEFSKCNKPVLTYGQSGERSHIDILGDLAYVYNNPEELINIIESFKKDERNYAGAYDAFAPNIIMEKFKKVFLS